jgi:hypothetical protein
LSKDELKVVLENYFSIKRNRSSGFLKMKSAARCFDIFKVVILLNMYEGPIFSGGSKSGRDSLDIQNDHDQLCNKKFKYLHQLCLHETLISIGDRGLLKLFARRKRFYNTIAK